jgi:hypothetical protein
MEVTEAFIEQAWSREQEPLAQLVTIRSDALAEPLRVTNWQGGLTSNDEDFAYYPFSLAWAGSSKGNPFGGARLIIANVDRRIEEAADASDDMVEIDLALVRVAAPDTVEKAIDGARIPSIEGDAGRVQAAIRPRDFSQEPACARKYLPATTPGLF